MTTEWRSVDLLKQTEEIMVCYMLLNNMLILALLHNHILETAPVSGHPVWQCALAGNLYPITPFAWLLIFVSLIILPLNGFVQKKILKKKICCTKMLLLISLSLPPFLPPSLTTSLPPLLSPSLTSSLPSSFSLSQCTTVGVSLTEDLFFIRKALAIVDFCSECRTLLKAFRLESTSHEGETRWLNYLVKYDFSM